MATLLLALRTLLRSPLYFVTFIGVGALGFAAILASVALVDLILIRPLPYAQPEELFAVRGGYRAYPSQASLLSAPDARDWRDAVSGLPVAAATAVSSVGLSSLTPHRLHSAAIDSDFLSVLRVSPLFGGFTAGDFNKSESAERAVISYRLWRSLSGSSRSDEVIIQFDRPRRTVRVAGVLPPDFVFPASGPQPDLLFPLTAAEAEYQDRAGRSLFLILRVAPPQLPIIQSRLDAAAQESAGKFPAESSLTLKGFDRAVVSPVAEIVRDPEAARAAMSSLGLGGILLLLVCVNLAALTAARWQARAKEITTRYALGAPRRSVIHLPICEGAIATLMALTLGAVTAAALWSALMPFAGSNLPPNFAGLLNRRILLAGGGVSAVFFVVTVMWPALAVTRRARMGRSHGSLGAVRRLRLLIAAQIALGFVLVLAGLLSVITVATLWSDVGYDYRGLLAIEMFPPTSSTMSELYRTIETVSRTPGVVAAAAFDGPLLQGTYRADASWIPPRSARPQCLAGPKLGITAGFFDVMKVSLIRGRFPTRAEMETGRAVAAISRDAAEACWPGRDPLNRTLVFGDRTYTIVGIVADARFTLLNEDVDTNEFYFPLSLVDSPPILTILAMVSGDIQTGLQNINRSLIAHEHAEGLSRVFAVRDALRDSATNLGLAARVLAALAACALAIVTSGVAGLVAMSVEGRMKEMAVRLALGATPTSLITLLMREQSLVVGAGLGFGGLTVVWLLAVARDYGVEIGQHHWSGTLLAIVAIVCAVTMGAGFSARRLRAADPSQLLRTE